MQSDRELLELAAKAAGYSDFTYCELCGGSPALYLKEAHLGIWAPLTDDGDALRLAVKLRISVAHWKEDVSALHPSTNREFPEACASCPYAATRRAIVRAAAKIGAQAHPDHKDGGADE
ncbi:hypothetical protein [Achromobacter sp. UBA2119]|uniref:hypothetical protein n=1 Tax=Achromobacter sp. UBA2119 TaxID=1945911 RepID=UPI0025803953|nr:hypothetical protein [Achromobacter sp. UBA2119]